MDRVHEEAQPAARGEMMNLSRAVIFILKEKSKEFVKII
jgi:hypothetical protein